MDLILFAKMKKYVDDTVAGSGSLQGKSAYDIAVEGGFEGSEAEWLESLQGTSPHIGENGNWYIGEEDTGISAVPLAAQDAKGIVDVTELPIEGINEGAFYRLVSAQFVYNKEVYSDWTCYSVNSLPEYPEPVSIDMVNITSYYNIQDGVVYGYADENISTVGGVPVGWYTIDALGQAFNVSWSGVITHIDDDPEDDTFRVLLKYELYVYKDEWMNVSFGYENPPAFDIKWDGDMTNHMVLDMSSLGYNNLYYIKVSDKVLSVDELRGATMEAFNYINNENESAVIGKGSVEGLWINDQMFDGAIVVTDFYNNANYIIVVYDVDALATSLGIPTGVYTNGIYFYLYANEVYISRLVAPIRVTKIDSKFIDVDTSTLDNLATVATSGSYNDLSNKPTIYTDVIRYNTSQSLSNTNKSRARTNIDVYSKSEVDTKITTAIGTAIGSGY